MLQSQTETQTWRGFSRNELFDLADQLGPTYRTAAPFPHVIIDGMLPESLLDHVVAEFPVPTPEWRHFEDRYQRKFGASDLEVDLGPVTRQLLAEFNGGAFTTFVERLTGIDEPLIPDPHFRGGGLHQSTRGGYLKIHADFNKHPTFGLDRRVNVLLYLNRDWDPAWGGQLELWDKAMTTREVVVEPVFNRCVIFTITDDALHGHPDPLRAPDGVTRKSMALYYYSNGRPADEEAGKHSTLWQNRPGELLY